MVVLLELSSFLLNLWSLVRMTLGFLVTFLLKSLSPNYPVWPGDQLLEESKLIPFDNYGVRCAFGNLQHIFFVWYALPVVRPFQIMSNQFNFPQVKCKCKQRWNHKWTFTVSDPTQQIDDRKFIANCKTATTSYKLQDNSSFNAFNANHQVPISEVQQRQKQSGSEYSECTVHTALFK